MSFLKGIFSKDEKKGPPTQPTTAGKEQQQQQQSDEAQGCRDDSDQITDEWLIAVPCYSCYHFVYDVSSFQASLLLPLVLFRPVSILSQRPSKCHDAHHKPGVAHQSERARHCK